MERNEIPFLTATELAELYRSGQLSPVEATESYLSRIEQVDPALNSYITVTAEQARAEARQAESEISAGNYRGPLHGIPVAVKDQFCTAGVATTGGSEILRDYVPDYDATVMAKLKDAGGVLLGKLNMSEFAMGDAFHHPTDGPGIPGTSPAIPEPPAVAPVPPPRPSFVPLPWARIPQARFAVPPPSAAWSGSGRP